MGWKNVKEYFRIAEPVHIVDGRLMIGVALKTRRIVEKDGRFSRRIEGDGIAVPAHQVEMEAQPQKVSLLLRADDTFERSITVYTFTDGKIIEKLCENAGWPNVTHDGALMLRERYSTDLNEVVVWAKADVARKIKETKASLKATSDRLRHEENNLLKQEQMLAGLNNAYLEG